MRATYIGCIGTHVHGCQVTPLLCSSSCEIASWCVQGLLEAYFKIKKKNSGEQEKESIIRVRAG